MFYLLDKTQCFKIKLKVNIIITTNQSDAIKITKYKILKKKHTVYCLYEIVYLVQ